MGEHQALDLILPENLISLFNPSRVDTNPPIGGTN